MGAVLVFCLSKMWLKYIKDISMFNYKPKAIFFLCICVFCAMTACWMSQMISQMWQGRALIYVWLEHKLQMEEKL